MRSQTATGYPAQYAPYPAGQVQQQAAFYPASTDPRMAGSPVSGYEMSGGAGLPRRSSMSVDRTVPSRMSSTHGMPPYARAPPSLSSEYGQESISEQPIKKKRKRAGKCCDSLERYTILTTCFSRCRTTKSLERDLQPHSLPVDRGAHRTREEVGDVSQERADMVRLAPRRLMYRHPSFILSLM